MVALDTSPKTSLMKLKQHATLFCLKALVQVIPAQIDEKTKEVWQAHRARTLILTLPPTARALPRQLDTSKIRAQQPPAQPPTLGGID